LISNAKMCNPFSNGMFSYNLKKLELNPEKFGKLSGSVETTIEPDLFDRYQMRFPITAIVSALDVLSLRKMLSQKGFSVSKAH
jgi:hypothetical protein